MPCEFAFAFCSRTFRSMALGMSELCKVLIAEDEIMIRQGIRHLIDWRKYGFEIVAETKNGIDALEKIEKYHPHIVISDIVMPVMNGIELINEISRRYPGIQVIVLSGHSDFEYVKATFRSGAIDYILKPSLNPADLLSTMKLAAKRITSFSLSPDYKASTIDQKFGQILSGYYSDETLSSVIDYFPKPYFTLFGMDARYALGPYANMELIAEYIDLIAPDYLMGLAYSHIIYNNVLLFIINHCTGDNVECSLAAMTANISKHSQSVFFVCSECFSEAQNIHKIYNNDFATYLSKRFYHKHCNFITVSQLRETECKATFNSIDFSKLLGIGGVMQAIDLLREQISEMLWIHRMDETELKSLAQNAIYQITMTLEEMLVKMDKLESVSAELENLRDLKRDCLARVNKPYFAKEFEAEFSAAMDDLAGFFTERLCLFNKSVMSKVLDYINNNYSAPLSLEKLARQFNFSYHYLSAYFGTNNQESFSKYLNHIRITQAQKMLMDVNNSISDICFSVGYSDHSYFTQVFKKFTGLTPKAYRLAYLPGSKSSRGFTGNISLSGAGAQTWREK